MITKLGKSLNKEDQKNLALAEGIGGGLAINKSKKSGLLTGRKRLYHGTDTESAKKILKEGLKGSQTGRSGSITKDVLEKSNPKAYKDSIGKSFLAPKYHEGLSYAVQSQNRNVLGRNAPRIEKFSDFGKVIKADIPIWKPEFSQNKILNPEIAGETFDEWYKRISKNSLIPPTRTQARGAYNSFKRAYVHKGDIPTRYIKGGKNYAKATPREFLHYIKARPGKAALGAGIAAGGATLIGDSIRRYIKHKT
jgi:hypothetical protein